jgi:hypothetical protein
LSDLGKNPREFQPVEPREEIFKFLLEGAKLSASTLVWTKDQETVLQTNLSVFSETDQTLFVWIPKDFDVNRLVGELAKQDPQECFFSVSLSRANLFFKCRFLGVDSAGFKFAVPEKAYKVQRRKTIRYHITEGYFMPLEFEDPLFPGKALRTKVFDISSGGVSFLAPEKDDPIYQKGMTLKKVKFTIRLRVIQAEAEIRHKKSHEDGMIKVGLEFKDLPAAQTELISSYVLEENRKYYTRFL